MCTVIMWQQMKYMQEQDLGFDKDKMLVVDINKLPWTLRHDKAPLFKNRIAAQERNAGNDRRRSSTRSLRLGRTVCLSRR